MEQTSVWYYMVIVDRRQDDIDRQKAKLALEEMEVRDTCTFQPEINSRSKDITQRQRQKTKSPENQR
jgi:hypothetical protein